jgi:phosphopantothenoylcysteine decarboxylase/phosphopantothenate--cysteine ligase
MKVLITAGPTREPIDPVRYLSNRSSGKMGYALAEAAITLGHEVTLVSGPVQIPPPALAKVISVETAREMYEAVQREIGACEIAIFSAAVADYRPLAPAAQKIKKHESTLTLELERTEDILGSARSVFAFTGFLVGFAAETEKLVEHAQSKLRRKGCDLVIANDVSQPGIGFDSSENAVTLCHASGEIQTLPQQSKQALASVLITQITRLAISSSSSLHV